MSTQFGNFLYQVDAKQFPGNRIAAQKNMSSDQFKLQQLQAYQQKNIQPHLDIQHVNPKQIHKQLKQFYNQQKKDMLK